MLCIKLHLHYETCNCIFFKFTLVQVCITTWNLGTYNKSQWQNLIILSKNIFVYKVHIRLFGSRIPEMILSYCLCIVFHTILLKAWASSGFHSFLPLPKKTFVGGLPTCVWMNVWMFVHGAVWWLLCQPSVSVTGFESILTLSRGTHHDLRFYSTGPRYERTQML